MAGKKTKMAKFGTAKRAIMNTSSEMVNQSIRRLAKTVDLDNQDIAELHSMVTLGNMKSATKSLSGDKQATTYHKELLKIAEDTSTENGKLSKERLKLLQDLIKDNKKLNADSKKILEKSIKDVQKHIVNTKSDADDERVKKAEAFTDTTYAYGKARREGKGRGGALKSAGYSMLGTNADEIKTSLGKKKVGGTVGRGALNVLSAYTENPIFAMMASKWKEKAVAADKTRKDVENERKRAIGSIIKNVGFQDDEDYSGSETRGGPPSRGSKGGGGSSFSGTSGIGKFNEDSNVWLELIAQNTQSIDNSIKSMITQNDTFQKQNIELAKERENESELSRRSTTGTATAKLGMVGGNADTIKDASGGGLFGGIFDSLKTKAISAITGGGALLGKGLSAIGNSKIGQAAGAGLGAYGGYKAGGWASEKLGLASGGMADTAMKVGGGALGGVGGFLATKALGKFGGGIGNAVSSLAGGALAGATREGQPVYITNWNEMPAGGGGAGGGILDAVTGGGVPGAKGAGGLLSKGLGMAGRAGGALVGGASSLMSAAAPLAGPALAVAGAGAAGYAVGTALNNYVLDPMLAGGRAESDRKSTLQTEMSNSSAKEKGLITQQINMERTKMGKTPIRIAGNPQLMQMFQDSNVSGKQYGDYLRQIGDNVETDGDIEGASTLASPLQLSGLPSLSPSSIQGPSTTQPTQGGFFSNLASKASDTWQSVKASFGNVISNIGSAIGLKPAPGVDMSGVNPVIKDRLSAMAAEYKTNTGKDLQINSAYRSPEKQKQLYEQHIAKGGKPGMVAKPGKSMHEYGVALDIQSKQASELWNSGLMQKYGFFRPLFPPSPPNKSNVVEEWHTEPVEIAGKYDQIRKQGGLSTTASAPPTKQVGDNPVFESLDMGSISGPNPSTLKTNALNSFDGSDAIASTRMNSKSLSEPSVVVVQGGGSNPPTLSQKPVIPASTVLNNDSSFMNSQYNAYRI